MSEADVFKAPILPASTAAVKAEPKVEPADSPAEAEPVEVKVEIKEDDKSGSIADAKASGPVVKAKAATEADAPVVAYTAPPWGSVPAKEPAFSLQVLKSGSIIHNISLNSTGDKSFMTVGRLASCDIQLEHPSISRYHAVLQYGTDPMQPRHAAGLTCGWHVFDLASTHGTFKNKQRLPAKQYVRCHVGHVIKFGGSTRLHILQGPAEDEENESKYTVTEIKARADRRKLIAQGILDPDPERDADLVAQKKCAATAADADGSSSDGQEDSDSASASWGMNTKYGRESDSDNENSDGGEDGIDFEELQNREAFYKDDPRKALMHFLEREGLDDEVDFEYVEKGSSFRHQWSCTIRIPVDERLVVAEALSSGSKKEAQAQCALKACQLLDAADVLRRARGSRVTQQRKKAQKLKENDFYDSDEDEFYDRTGEMEQKRRQRQHRLDAAVSSAAAKAHTYDDLCKQLAKLESERSSVENELTSLGAHVVSQRLAVNADADALDLYMNQVQRGAQQDSQDTQEVRVRKSQLRQQIVKLNKEMDRINKLCKVAKPIALPTGGGDKLAALRSRLWAGSLRGKAQGARAAIANQRPAPLTDADEAPSARVKTDEKFVEENEEDESSGSDAKQTATGSKPAAAQQPDTPDTVAVEHKQPKAAPPEKKKVTVEDKSTTEQAAPSSSSCKKRPSDPDTKAGAPDQAAAEAAPAEEQPEPPVKKQRSRQRQRPTRPHKEDGSLAEYDGRDPDFAVWLPPSDQRGDGKTSLNEKLGY